MKAASQTLSQSDKERARALYRANASRSTVSAAALIDEFFQARQRRQICRAANFAPGVRVLDLGAGQGHLVKVAKAAGAHVTAVDVVPSLVTKLATSADVAYVGDLDTLQVKEKFDRVLLIGVLDFVAKPQTVLLRLTNAVAPGGKLIVLVPTRLFGQIYRFEKWLRGVRVNLFDPKVCAQVVARGGLQLESLRRPLPTNVLMTFRRPSAPNRVT